MASPPTAGETTYDKTYILALANEQFQHLGNARWRRIEVKDGHARSESGSQGRDAGDCRREQQASDSTGDRRRRRVIEDDEDVDEEAIRSQAAVSEKTDHAEEPDMPDMDSNADAPEPCQKQRLVLLSIKVAANTTVNFAISEKILEEIPDYLIKLDRARINPLDGKRLFKIRKEETVIQAIEYLTDGILEPLDAHYSGKCLATLSELTTLYGFSVSMHISTLEAAIISHIGQYAFDPSTLVYFTTDCYREVKDGPKVAPESSLGRLIKEYLAENLQAIFDDAKAKKYIKEYGGPTLNKQLVEVFSENMLAEKQVRTAADKLKVEVE